MIGKIIAIVAMIFLFGALLYIIRNREAFEYEMAEPIRYREAFNTVTNLGLIGGILALIGSTLMSVGV